jgi:hypothetical protein
MKYIHICNRSTWEKHKNEMFFGAFWELPNGQIIHIGEWADHKQANFEKEPDVIALPSFLDSTPIGSQAASVLSFLGIKETHKTFEAMQILKKSHAAFAPSQF